MEKYFKLNERGTSVRTEFIAGMTTFFAMVYILMVNANMFADPFGDGSNPLGVSYGAIYIATAISAVAVPFWPALFPICPWQWPAVRV